MAINNKLKHFNKIKYVGEKQILTHHVEYAFLFEIVKGMNKSVKGTSHSVHRCQFNIDQ